MGGVEIEHTPEPDARPVRADGSISWLEETVVDRAGPKPPLRRSSVLGAAMIAVGEIIEPEKTRVDIEIRSEVPSDQPYDLPFEVGFGDLPDLD